MASIEKINDTLLKELALLANRELELPGALITISFVHCSSDLNHAKVGISVLPLSMAGTALKTLRHKASVLAHGLQKTTYLRRIPKLVFILDETEMKAEQVEEAIEEEGEILKHLND